MSKPKSKKKAEPALVADGDPPERPNGTRRRAAVRSQVNADSELQVEQDQVDNKAKRGRRAKGLPVPSNPRTTLCT